MQQVSLCLRSGTQAARPSAQSRPAPPPRTPPFPGFSFLIQSDTVCVLVAQAFLPVLLSFSSLRTLCCSSVSSALKSSLLSHTHPQLSRSARPNLWFRIAL